MAELGFALSTSAFEKDFRSVTIDLSPQLPLLSLKKKSETSGQHQELSIQICGTGRPCQPRELKANTHSHLSSPYMTSSVSQLPVGWLTVIQMPKIAIQRLVSAGWVSFVNSSRKKMTLRKLPIDRLYPVSSHYSLIPPSLFRQT